MPEPHPDLEPLAALLAAMSHELRSPLNLVIALPETIIDDALLELPPPVAQGLGTIQRKGLALLNLLSDIVDYAALEAGTLALAPERIALPPLLDGLLAHVETLLPEHPMAWDTHIPPDAPDVFADWNALRQILRPLLVLSSVFSPDAAGVITLAAGPGAGEVQVTVHGHGVAFAAEDGARLFRPRQDFHNPATGQTHTTGLGLAVAYHLARASGGHLALDDDGARFVLVLPAANQRHS